eukprot:COSAG01_NODE_692_length_14213_cov_3.971518_12_plen_114_part_00
MTTQVVAVPSALLLGSPPGSLRSSIPLRCAYCRGPALILIQRRAIACLPWGRRMCVSMCITLLTVLLCVGGASEQAAKYKASDSRKFGAQTGPGAVLRNIGWSRPITHNHGSR